MPTLRLVLAFVALLSAAPAMADGIGQTYSDEGPCDSPFPTFEVYSRSVLAGDPAELYEMAKTIRASLCGDIPMPEPTFLKWRRLGFSDQDLLVFIFDGSEPDPLPPAPVPLPAAWKLLLTGLLALIAIKLQMRPPECSI